eukprot:gene8932-12046_t
MRLSWRLFVSILCVYLIRGNIIHTYNNLFISPSKRLIAESVKLNDIALIEYIDKIQIQSSNTSFEIYFNDQSDSLSFNFLNKKDVNIQNNVKPCKGIFGFYKLPLGYYIVVIKETKRISIDGLPEVEKIIKVELIKVPRKHITEEISTAMIRRQWLAEKLLLDTFSRHEFYFTSKQNQGLPYDLTRTFQSNSLNPSNTFNSCDSRYFWNRNAIEPLLANNLNEFVIPVTNAFISYAETTFFNEKFYLIIISRRSKRRQGPRYIKRGIDDNGDVANFVETEQILMKKDRSLNASFVQIRGSIPIFWNQSETWKLRPPIIPQNNLTLQSEALLSHLEDINSFYIDKNDKITSIPLEAQYLNNESSVADITFINLIDKKGTQGRLGKLLCFAFDNLRNEYNGNKTVENNLQSLVEFDENSKSDDKFSNRTILSEFEYDFSKSVGKVKLIWLDYHYKVKNDGVTAALHSLYQPLKDTLKNNYYFAVKNRKSNDSILVKSLQSRIIRTNCVDCLDRTNVVQTQIARWALIQQLQQLQSVEKISKSNDKLLNETDALPDLNVETLFRKLWAKNGDMLSMLYAGTRALKRDVTITGKRTRKGFMADGINSIKRYFINNYKDKFYQHGVDLIIGNESDSLLMNVSGEKITEKDNNSSIFSIEKNYTLEDLSQNELLTDDIFAKYIEEIIDSQQEQVETAYDDLLAHFKF